MDAVLPQGELHELVAVTIEEVVAAMTAAPPVPAALLIFAPPSPDERRAALVRDWLVRQEAFAFVTILHGRVLDRMPCSSTELRAFLATALRRVIGLRDDMPNSVRWLEVATLAESIDHGVRQAPEMDPVFYATNVRLLRNGIATPVGRVLSQLDGRDALRWLLTVELLQAVGPSDPMRLCEDTARYLLAVPEQLVEDTRWETRGVKDGEFPHSWRTLGRLERLGLLRISPDPNESRYRVWESGTSILGDILAADAPFRGLARALLGEDAASRIAERDQFLVASDRRAAEWVVETIAHGLRNALGPASFALERLADDVVSAGPGADRVARVRTGVDRAFKLVADLVSLHRASQGPAETFEVSAAIRDAVAVANGTGVSVEVDRVRGAVVRGRRLRLVHALVELVRNARQHPRGQQGVAVRVTAELEGDEIVIDVDDDGLGVEPAIRARIFERGFSTRPEGTGQGLALLREVLQGEYGGDIAVDDSPLGGARFRVRLKTARGV